MTQDPAASDGLGLPTELLDIVQSLPSQLSQLVDATACAFLQVTHDTFWVAASQGFRDDQHTLRFTRTEQTHLSAAIQQRRPTIISDVLVDARFKDFALFDGMRAGILAPMLHHDRCLGLLIVVNEQVAHYTEKHAQAIMAFAAQAAIAIENSRLYAETRRRALHLEAASQVGQKVIAILDIDTLLTEIVRLIRGKFGYYLVNILLVDKRTNELVLRECSGETDEPLKTRGLRLKIGEQGITGWVAQHGQPRLSNDTQFEPLYYAHDLAPKTRAELAVPLKIGDVVVGVLDVQSKQPNAFRTDDVTALQLVGDQVAIALENARLFRETRRQFEVMSALHDIALDITLRLGDEQVLHAILAQAAHLLHAKGSTIALSDPQSNLVRIAFHNFPFQYEGLALQPGEGVVGHVIASGQPVIVNDYRSFPGRAQGYHGEPYNAMLSVPLQWQGKIYGALSVVDRPEERLFNEDDAQLLALLAQLASITLKKTELHAQVVQLSQELEGKVEERTHELAIAREEIAQKAEELHRLLQRTVRIQEEERKRIALDLHDGSNQLLAGTLYELQAAEESVRGQREAMALDKLHMAKELLRKIESENRRIISGLRPPILDTQGLVATLKWHARQFENRYSIACFIHVSGKPVRLLERVETAIYRIVQESLNNVAAHAQAHNVVVRVSFGTERLRVSIEDDGVGFNIEQQAELGSPRAGLIGMRERVQSIQGWLDICSVPTKGTQIIVDVPIQEKAIRSELS